MKIRKNLVFLLGFIIAFLSPLCSGEKSGEKEKEKEKITITNPFQTTTDTIVLEISPLPQFIFSLNKTLRIRKTDGAAMYEYRPRKPDKPYRHLALFLELLGQETKTTLPKAEVVVVTRKEFLDIVEVDGIAWTEPLADESAKPRDGGLVWFAEGDMFRVFAASLKTPARVLVLEQFLAHLVIMAEWESSVERISPEDTEILIDRRKEEWKKQEGKALVLFHRISGHWKLLQLNWPPEPL